LSFCSVALVKGPQVVVDEENHPMLRREGYLSFKKGQKWLPFCVDPDENVPTLAATTCNHLGFRQVNSIIVLRKLQRKIQLSRLLFAPKNIVKIYLIGLFYHFYIFGCSYYNQALVQPVSNIPLPVVEDNNYISYDYQMLKDGTAVCNGLFLECGERLHTKPKDRIPECGDASWSWFAAIYKEGRYLCGATLVTQQLLITSSNCAQKIE